MGRVKDHFWEEIEARAASETRSYEPTEADELEALQMDHEFAKARYEAALNERKSDERRS